MDYLAKYFASTFVVICISIVLIITMIRKMKIHKRLSIYMLAVISLTLLISLLDIIHASIEAENKSLFGMTFVASLLYFLRPCCVLLFIFMCGIKFKGPWVYILLGLAGFNLIVNILPLIPPTSKLVFYYHFGEDGLIHWSSGSVTFFRFTPHIVSALYLVFLIASAFALLKRRHYMDGVGILICTITVTVATIIETFFNDKNEIYILPSAIAISTVFFYLFMYERENKLDILTGLFNRASYFDDLVRLTPNITGVVQLDMNGLKYLNDNYGHLEGDKGLKCIATAIAKNATNKMYAYRVGGDEFIVLAINENENNIAKFIASFKEEIKDTKYYCSLGYASKAEGVNNADEMFKLSEKRMYDDKAEFYKVAEFERRKTQYINQAVNHDSQ